MRERELRPHTKHDSFEFSPSNRKQKPNSSHTIKYNQTSKQYHLSWRRQNVINKISSLIQYAHLRRKTILLLQEGKSVLGKWMIHGTPLLRRRLQQHMASFLVWETYTDEDVEAFHFQVVLLPSLKEPALAAWVQNMNTQGPQEVITFCQRLNEQLFLANRRTVLFEEERDQEVLLHVFHN